VIQRFCSVHTTSATTLVSVRNAGLFQTALMALTDPHTLCRRIKCFPSPRRQVVWHTYLLYFAPAMWRHICTIRTTHGSQSSQGLQLCCSHVHSTSQWLWHSLAKCLIIPLRYCYISDAALSPYMLGFEMLSLITIQSSLQIHRLQLHLLRHYCILHVWNILSNLHTV